MGYSEDLAAALYGDQTQAAIAQENPYYQFKSAPDSYTSMILKQVGSEPYGTYSNGEIYGNVIASGILSGLLGSMGESYQNDLTSKVQSAALALAQGNNSNAESLSPNLFRRAQDAVGLFNLRRNMALRDKAEEMALTDSIKGPRAERTALIGAISKAQTPRQREQILSSLRQAGLIPGTAAEVESEPTAIEMPQSTGANRGIEGNILDDVSREANKLMDEGAKPEQAFTTAREAMKSKRDELDRQYKRVEEAEQSAASIKTLTGQIGEALSRAGSTGKGTSQSLAGWAGLVSEDQRKKYSAGQEVESFSNDAVKQFGRAFKGPMSDRDVQIMLRAAPSLANEKEANEGILQRWAYAAELQQTYADFMRAAQAKGVPVSEAEQAWNELKRANPYVIKKGGSYEINPMWLGGNPVASESSSQVSREDAIAELRRRGKIK